MALVEIEDVWFHYPSELPDPDSALRGITLNVEPGEFVAIVGHNGSGKSTLAKLINAILMPSKGVIRIAGMESQDQAHLWDIRRTAGMIFQNPDNQLVATIVEEDVAFGPENLGVPSGEIRQRVDEALAAVGMSQYAKAQPHHLSGGQKQRVAIAGILAMKPSILVMDEPTAMLDPLGRKDVMQTVQRLNRQEHITVIHITHFMDEAIQADRVIVVNQGQILVQGTPLEVFLQRELLSLAGIELPDMVNLAADLRARGVPVDTKVLTHEQMLEELCRLKSVD